ncbi:MAG TPA: hypothetical protein VHL53_03165, partial [Acidimicrobiia bacterium]|nr:hypothetical protein [Acidimicrobiia bacterium]
AGRIGLRPAPGGFATPPFGADDQLRVEGATLVRRRDGTEEKAELTTLAAAADFAGVALTADPGIGHDPPPLGAVDAPLAVSAAAGDALGAWFAFSGSVLETFRAELDAAGRACSEVQLWPEHFDLGCSIEGVNFGCSPGDGTVPEPYLYVGPWDTAGFPDGGFWNAPFGAVLGYGELLRADDQIGTALAFLRRGADLAAERAQAG